MSRNLIPPEESLELSDDGDGDADNSENLNPVMSQGVVCLPADAERATEIAFLQQEVRGLSDRLRFTDLELATVRRERDVADLKQEEKQQSILRLEREKANLQEVHRKGIEDLMAINHALTARVRALEERVQEMDQASQAREQRSNALEDDVLQLVDQRKSLEVAHSHAEELLAEARASLETSRQSLAKTVKELQHESRERSRANQEAVRLTSHNAALRQKAEEALGLSQEYCSELVQTRESLNTKTKECASWARKMHEAEPVLERYVRDNARLLRVLSAAGGTVYSALVHEFEDAEECAYLPSPSHAPLDPLRSSNHDIQRVAQLYREPGPGQPRPIFPKKEGEHWVPVATFALACEFRNTFAPEVDTEVLVDFLSQLNQVWRRRGERREERLKADYKQRLVTQRRRHNMNTPSHELKLMQEIRWLKKELLKADRMLGTGRSLFDERHFDGALKMKYTDGNPNKDEEFAQASLQDAAFNMVAPRDSSDLGKAGATLVAWLGSCLLEMMDALLSTFVNLGGEHRIRMVDLPRADPDYYGRLLRMHNTFLEKIQGHVTLTRTKMADAVEKSVDQAVNMHLTGSHEGEGFHEEDYQ